MFYLHITDEVLSDIESSNLLVSGLEISDKVIPECGNCTLVLTDHIKRKVDNILLSQEQLLPGIKLINVLNECPSKNCDYGLGLDQENIDNYANKIYKQKKQVTLQ